MNISYATIMVVVKWQHIYRAIARLFVRVEQGVCGLQLIERAEQATAGGSNRFWTIFDNKGSKGRAKRSRQHQSSRAQCLVLLYYIIYLVLQ